MHVLQGLGQWFHEWGFSPKENKGFTEEISPHIQAHTAAALALPACNGGARRGAVSRKQLSMVCST